MTEQFRGFCTRFCLSLQEVPPGSFRSCQFLYLTRNRPVWHTHHNCTQALVRHKLVSAAKVMQRMTLVSYYIPLSLVRFAKGPLLQSCRFLSLAFSRAEPPDEVFLEIFVEKIAHRNFPVIAPRLFTQCWRETLGPFPQTQRAPKLWTHIPQT